MELHEFHVLKRQAGAQHHGIAVAGAGMRRGRGEIGTAIAAGCHDGHARAEAVDRAVIELERDHADAASFLVHDQVDGEILDEEFRRIAQRLRIQRMQHGMTGAVGGGAGALRDALAEIGGHAAERPLIDLAVIGPRERQAPMFEFVDGFRRVAHHILDRILIAEPVRALDGVVHVPAPVIRAHIAERCGDAALRRDRMRAGREHLGDAGGAQTRLRAADHRTQPGPSGPDDHHVKGVILDRVRAAIDRRCAVRFAAVALVVHGIKLRKTASPAHRGRTAR